MKASRRILFLGAVSTLFIFAAGIFNWYRRGILPSQRALVRMSTADLTNLILKSTPVGTSKSDVENALNYKFRRSWKENKSDGVGYMANLGFNVPISDGDYYFTSDFAVVGWVLPDVVTVRFLIDRTDKLKDVSIKTWSETL